MNKEKKFLVMGLRWKYKSCQTEVYKHDIRFIHNFLHIAHVFNYLCEAALYRFSISVELA